MKFFIKYCSIAFVALFCSNSYADFVSDTTTSNSPISVKEALTKANKTQVVLEGFILSQIRKEKYEFSDGKDTICVKIEHSKNGKKIMPSEDFNKTQKIRIKGEVDKDFEPFGDKCDKVKIDVSNVELLNKK